MVKCIYCGSDDTRVKEQLANGGTRYYCNNGNCSHKTFTKSSSTKNGKPKIGMTINEFRERHDVDFIVSKVLDKLDKDIIYEKNDICKMTGLRPGYPGLTPTIESSKNYYGKVGSIMYFSHPDTIQKLKDDAKLT